MHNIKGHQSMKKKMNYIHTNLKKIGAVLNDVRLYYQVSSNKSNIIGQRIRGSKSNNNLKMPTADITTNKHYINKIKTDGFC